MIYTNLKAVEANMHGIFESSRLKASTVGRILDLVVDDKDVDNGVPLKVGEPTGDGLQTRKADVAAIGDKVYIAGTPALVKDAYNQAQAQSYNFTNKAGKPIKAYEVLGDDYEIFAVADYQFTDDKAPVVGDYVVTDGAGKWVAQSTEPVSTYGFIGKVHSIAVGNFVNMVRIECIQNEQK